MELLDLCRIILETLFDRFMSTNKIKKLKTLIEKIEIINLDLRENTSLETFLSLEIRLGYKLPDDYKYFCQELGTGGNCLFEIYSISDRNLESLQNIGREMIRLIIENRELDGRELNSEYLQYIELLESALIFGGHNGEDVFLWYLRTYKSEDDSYDIYWYSNISPDGDKPILIGRNFTDFMYKFFYGQLPCSLIPDFCVNNEPIDVRFSYAYQKELLPLYLDLDEG
jgi:hypothetical protein